MKLFLALVITSLSYTSVVAQDLSATWYENFFARSKSQSSEKRSKKAEGNLREAIKQNDKPAEAKALIELGLYQLIHLSDYKKAMDLLFRSLIIEDSLGLNKEKIFTSLAMANVFEQVEDYSKSAELLHQAWVLSEKEKDLAIFILILNETGRVNAVRGRVDEAFENYEIALGYAQKLERRDAEADALFHAGQILARKENYKEALAKHKESLSIRRSLGDKAKEAQSLNDIGEVYRAMKNESRAMANHEAALEVRQAIKDKKGMAESYIHIGTLQFTQKNYDPAILNFKLGLQAAREAQERDQISKSYDYLSRCYRELKDFEKALDNRESFLAIEGLIQGEKNEMRLLESEMRYEMQQKKSEIDQLESDKAQRDAVINSQRQVRKFLVLLIIFGVIILVLLSYLYFLKQRANRQLQELNATKDKLFSIIGHDLKGPLNSLTSFSYLLLNHADSLTKDEIRMLSNDLDKSLKNLFNLLENLLEWSRSQTGNIDFKAEVFDLAVMLKDSEELLKGQMQLKKITLVSEDKVNLWVNAHRQSINTVVRNLLSNAIKFTPEGGKIALNVKGDGNQYVVSVTDTGVGMDPPTLQKLFRLGSKHSTLGTAQEKGTGLGLILCKDFVEKNGGTIGVESQEGVGSKFYFSVPMNSVAG